MKNVVYFLFLLISIVAVSCTNKKKLDEAPVISLNEVSEEKRINDLFDSFEYIPLETSDECFFGMVDKLVTHKKQFYILDKTRTKKIYVYNDDGSFSHVIGTTGSGPGEYANLEDFTIDEEKERVIVLTYPSTVYVYNLQGNFQYSKKLGESLLWDISSYKGGFVCSTNHQSYTEGEDAFLLFFFDDEFNLQNKLLPVLPRQVAIPPFVSNPLMCSGSDIAYFDNFTNLLHLVPMNNTETVHTIQFELEAMVTPDVLNDTQTFLMNQRDYSFFLEAFYNGNTFWSFFTKKGKLCSLMANVKTGEKKISHLAGWFPKILSYQNSTFYSAVSPQEILEDEDSLFSPAKNAKFLIDEDSNPVVIKFKAKQSC